MANTIYRHDKYGLWAPKDPGSRLDYGFNWVDRLQPLETIASSVWSAETSGIAVSSTYVSNTKSIFWCSGGTSGGTYWIRNWILTNQSRQFVLRFRFKVTNR
jgi:hypothetical protein